MCVPKDVCGDSCTSREYTEHTGLHTFSGRVVWAVRDNSVTLFCAGVSRMANGGWTASARKAEAQGWEVWAAKDLGALGGRPVSTGLGHPGFRALQKPSLTAARPTDAMTPLTQLCTRGIQGGQAARWAFPASSFGWLSERPASEAGHAPEGPLCVFTLSHRETWVQRKHPTLRVC